MATYRPSTPYERPPLHRRASGLALALAINLGLLFVLLGIGSFVPVANKPSHTLIVDLEPESRRAESPAVQKEAKKLEHPRNTAVPKPPPIVLPSKPTISVPPPRPPQPPSAQPWVEMSKAEMAAGEIGNLPKSGTSGAGDSDVVGHGPHGELLYAAEWARHPTHAELSGYLPANAPDGFGAIACRTIADNRVDDCFELDQEPRGSHLASAVRQAAWQFRIRPPRKNGVPLVGSWVSIRIDYESYGRGSSL